MFTVELLNRCVDKIVLVLSKAVIVIEKHLLLTERPFTLFDFFLSNFAFALLFF